MKKKIIFGILAAILATALTTTGIVVSQADYSLNTEEFDNELIYEETFSTDGLVIIKDSVTGTEEIQVTTDMIVSGMDTSSVGDKTLTIQYKNETFTVDYSVKYQVNFYVQNELVSSQNILTMSELIVPEAPFITGYEFDGWSPEIPATISDNLDFDATLTAFDEKIPVLLATSATYGDMLHDIVLPSNEYGRWVFTAEEGTTVGNAGVNRFEAKFIPSNENQESTTGTVVVNVAKKEVSFSNITTEFTYDGTPKKPTFDLDIDIDDSKITFIGEGTDVGEYNYSIRINDNNYKGSCYGSFIIKKANVTITIADKEIMYKQNVPDIEYTVDGISEEYLKISTQKPTVSHAGTYSYILNYDNDNVNVEIIGGTLTVNKANFADVGINIPNPEVTLTYEDVLSNVSITNLNPNGNWEWVDSSIVIDNSDTEKFTYNEESGKMYYQLTLRFVPRVATDFNEFTREITYEVQKKELTINFDPDENVYSYDGNPHTIAYSIEEGQYNDIEVLGIIEATNAGTYNTKLTINDYRYFGSTNAYIKIDKSPYPADFSEVKYGKYNNTLASIELPSGYSWIEPNTVLENVSKYTSYPAKYTPEDLDNYKVVEGSFSVYTNKASTASIEVKDNKDNFEFTYTGSAISVIHLFTAKNTDGTVELSYYLGEDKVESIKEAGTYTVKANIPETKYYLAAEEKTVTIVVKLSTDIVEPTSFVATYGDTLGMLELPESEYGVWTWKAGNDTSVGNVGKNGFNAIFTATNPNYSNLERYVEVEVSSRQIYFKVKTNEFTYDGGAHSVIYELYLDEECTIPFVGSVTVTGNDSYTNAGTYISNLGIAGDIVDGVTYQNNVGSLNNVTLTINKQIVTKPTEDNTSFTYNGSEQTYNIEESELYTIEGNNNKQTNAGEYTIKVTLTDSANYKWNTSDESTVTYSFIINKLAVSEPTLVGEYEYTGSEITAELNGYDSSYMSITGNVGIDAGNYEIIVTLDGNHEWEEGLDGKINWTINPKNIEVEWSTSTSYNYTGSTLTRPTAAYEGASITVTCDKEGFKDAGNYVFTASTTDSNYYITNPTLPITVNKGQAEIDVVITPVTITYGETHTPRSVTANFGTPSCNYNTDLVNAGTYTVTYTVAGTDNYNGAEVSYTVTIAKAQAVITVDNTPVEITYGTTHTPRLATANFGTPSCNYEADLVNAGSYTVTYTVTGTDNYNGAEVSYTVTIAKAKVEKPTADTNVFTYNGSAQTYRLAESNLYTITGTLTMTNAGSTEITVSLNDSANYEWVDGTTANLAYTFTIAKAKVDKPVADPTVFTYIGYAQTYSLAESNLYAITGTLTKIDAGSTNITVSLNDTLNYEWADGTTDDLTYTFTIAKAQAVITVTGGTDDVIITYGEDTHTVRKASTNFGNVTYSHSGVLSNAGTYTIKYTVTGTDNYNGAEVSYTVTIAKAKVDKPVADPTIFTYTGSAQTYSLAESTLYTITGTLTMTNAGSTNITVSLNDTLNYEWANGKTDDLTYTFTIAKAQAVITVDTTPVVLTYGETHKPRLSTSNFGTPSCNYNTDLVNVGTYTITYTVADTDNYYAAVPVSYSVIINKGQAVITVEGGTSDVKITYGETHTPRLATSNFGDVIQTTEGNTVNVGTYKVIYTVVGTDNYAGTSVNYTVTIAKAKVEKPTADATVFTYTGSAQTYSLAESTLYTITGTLTKTDAGSTNITVSLNDTLNYEWADGTTDDLTYTFTIAKAQAVITVTGGTDDVIITYGEDTHTVRKASTNFGDVTCTHSGVLTNAGTYTIKYTVTGTDNYNGAEVSYTVTIAKAKVDKPVADPTVFTYTGYAQTYSLAESTLYTITGTLTMTNAGSTEITVSLNDSANYEWADGTTDDLIYTFKVNQATTIISVDGGTDDVSFTYGEDTHTVRLATSNFGELNCTHSGVLVNAGTFTVTYTVAGTTNYTEATASYTVTIARAQAVITVSTINEMVYYTGIALAPRSASTNFGEIDQSIEGDPINVGTYTVKYIVEETANYYGAEESYQVTILQAETIITVDTTLVEITYGETHTPRLATSNFGDVIQTTEGDTVNVGSYKVIYKVIGNDNYTSAEESYTVTINKAKVTKPTADTTVFTYTGSVQTYQLTESTLYTITGNKQTNADEYNVTVTLNDSVNYSWSDGTTTVLLFTFVINKAQAQITVDQTPINVTYGTTPVLPTASTTFGNVEVTTEGDTVNVGSYTVIYTVAGTSNYEGDSKSLTVVIDKLGVNAPVLTGSYTYTGEEQTAVLTGLESYMTASGNKATNAGTYTITIDLDGNHKWNDGQVSTISWTIAQAQAVITVDDSNVNIVYGTVHTPRSASTNFGTVTCNYKSDLVNAGSYIVTYTVAGTDNYEGTTASYDVVIEKLGVNAPVLTGSYTYTGEEQTAVLTGLESYMTASGNKATNAGTYTITIDLDGNHKWNDGQVSTISWTIEKAQAVITVDDSNVNIVYGTVHTPRSASTNFGKVTCNYESNLVNAGSYTVTYTVVGDTNFLGTTVSYTVTINKATYDMSGVKWNYTSLTYNGEEQTVTLTGLPEGVTADYINNSATNAGNYTATATLNYDTTNYNEISVDALEWSIAPKSVNVNWTISASYVYTGSILTSPTATIKLVTGVNYGMDVSCENVFKNAGSYTFTASTTDENINNNYAISKTTKTVTVAKQKVNVPTISAKEYNGSLQTADIEDTTIYTVLENAGGTEVGTYDVVLKLNDFDNYEWLNDSSSATITVSFAISKSVNSWLTEPSIEGWTYGDDPNAPTYEAKYGDVVVEYAQAGSDSYSTTVPTNAGDYNVRFTVSTTEDYNGLSTILAFTIAKKKVAEPTVSGTYAYNTENQTVELLGFNASYMEVSGNVQKNAGTYEVTVTLTDDNYEWAEGSDGKISWTIAKGTYLPTAPTFTVDYGTKLSDLVLSSSDDGVWTWISTGYVGNVGTNTFSAKFVHSDTNYNECTNVSIIVTVEQATTIITDLSITGWIYGNDANDPTAQTNFGTIAYTYSSDGVNYVSTVPTNAGTYTVKASVVGNDNYTDAEVTYEFTISKADPTVVWYEEFTTEWGVSLSSIVLSEGFSWTVDVELTKDKISNTTKYNMTYTPEDTDNYNILNKDILVKVTKKSVSFEIQYTEFTYNPNNTTGFNLGVTHNNDELSTITYSYVYKYSDESAEENVSAVIGSGSYVVNVSIAESDHYFAANDSFNVSVAKATETIYDDTTAEYGDTLSDVKVPDSEYGTWTLSMETQTYSSRSLAPGAFTEVGAIINATATFTPENIHFNKVVKAITIKIVKREIDIVVTNNTFTYDKTTHVLEYSLYDRGTLFEEELEISGNVGRINAGEEKFTLEIINSNYYCGTTSATLIVEKATFDMSGTSWDYTSFEYDETLKTVLVTNLPEDLSVKSYTNNTATNAGKYTASVTFEYDIDNYNAPVFNDLSWQIQKRKVTEPTVSGSYTYTGSEQTVSLDGLTSYMSVTDNKQTNAGTYTVIVSLTDTDNNEWNTGSDGNISWTIAKAQAQITVDTTSVEITYGTKHTPRSATANFGTPSCNYNTDLENAGEYTVTYTVAGTNNYYGTTANYAVKINKAEAVITVTGGTENVTITYGEATHTIRSSSTNFGDVTCTHSGVLTNAGTYVIKYSVAGTTNYYGAEVSYTLTIAKAKVIKPTADAKVFTYTGSAQTYSLAESNLYAISGTLTMTNAGSTKITVSLNDSANYEWADGTTANLTYTFTIAKAQAVITVTGGTEDVAITYGETHTARAASANFGEVQRSIVGDTVNAGSYKVTYTVTGTDNYNGEEVSYTVTINKAKVDKPTADATVFTYTGEEQTYSLAESNLYTITGTLTMINAGSTEITVSLKDTLNYEWADGTTANLTYTFTIAKAQAVITVTGGTENVAITYGETHTARAASANFGEVQRSIVGDTVNAGSYTVTYTVTGTDNYNGAEVSYTVTIAKAKVNKPTADATVFTYTGYAQTYSLAESTLYTITGTLTMTNAGSTGITVSLKDTLNYEWADGTTANLTYTFTIAKAQAVITVTGGTENVAITYGTAHTPRTATTNVGEATCNYEADLVNVGEYTVTYTVIGTDNYAGTIVSYKVTIAKAQAVITVDTTPVEITYGTTHTPRLATANFGTPSCNYNTDLVNAGTYTVTYTVTGTDNYNGAELSYTVTIAKAKVTKPTADATVFTYNGSAQTYRLAESNLYTITGTLTKIDAGSTNITVSLNDTLNYEWADETTDDLVYTFTIAKAKAVITVTGGTEDVAITYGTAHTPRTATTNVGEATCNYEADLVNVGEYTVTYTVAGTDNYNGAEVSYKVTIAKAKVEKPIADATVFTYNGNEQTYSLEESTLYTITGILTMTNAGSTNITVSLNDSANYEWADGTTANLVYTFTIAKAQAVITVDTTPVEITYGTTHTPRLATANFGTPSCNYNTDLVNAGTYTVTYTVTGADNYEGTTTSYTVIINKRDVVVVWETEESYSYTGSNLTAPTAYITLIDSSTQYMTVTCNKSAFKNAGDYVFTASISDINITNNYNITNTTNNISIAKATPATSFANTYSVSWNTVLGTITLPAGYSWDNPELVLSTIGANQEFAATFTPDDTTNYNTVSGKFKVTVNKIQTVITSQSEYSVSYTGEAQNVGATINHSEANIVYTYYLINEDSSKTVVDSLLLPGTYEVIITVADSDHYIGTSKTVSYVINKVDITETVPTGLVGVYGQKLSEISLPSSTKGTWYWNVDTNTVLSTIGDNTFEARLVPNDSYYNILYVNVVVTVSKAETIVTATIPTGLTYTGSAISYSSWFTANHDLTNIAVSITLGGTTVSSITNVGNYTLTVTMLETAYYTSYSNTFDVTVSKANYTPLVTSPSLNAVYYTQLSAISVTASDGTWTWNSPTDRVGNVGTNKHKATFTPTNTNYNTSEYELSIVVTQATTEITGFTVSGWTYTPNPTATASATSNFGTVVYVYSTSESGEYTTTLPVNAGTYYAKARVAGTANYSSAETAALSFVITKANPTITWPVYGNVYEDRFNGVNDATTKASASVAGSFAYTNAIYGNSTITVTFTPNDTTNYNTMAKDIAVNVLPVAMIGSTNYGTLMKALAAAVSGDTVTIIVGANPYLTANATIPSGVTLFIPHTDGASLKTTSATAELNTTTDKHAYQTTSNLKSTLTISAGITLTNNGIIEISGQITGGGGGHWGGYTSGLYSRIVLQANAKIESSGTIYCYGYIEESSTNNGSEVNINSGNIYLPFVLFDFLGGSQMYALYDNMGSKHAAPFNQFNFVNVTSILNIDYNGSLFMWANLFANDQQNFTSTQFLGNSAGVFQFTNSSSSLKYKYDRSTEISKLEFYGGMDLNSLTLELKVLTTISISTDNVYFPFSWRWNVELKLAEGQASATYNMNHRVKLMAGTKLTVDSGVTLNVLDFVIYSDYKDTSNRSVKYPTDKSQPQFIINGTLNATSIAGTVLTTSESGAKINVTGSTEITVYEPSSISGSSFLAKVDAWKTIVEKFRVYQYAGGEEMKLVDSSAGEYFSRECGWYSPNIYIYFDSNGGTLNSVENILFENKTEGLLIEYSESAGSVTINTNVINNPLREYYTFAGWYLDSEGTESINGFKTYANITVYAKWKLITYDIVYEDVFYSESDSGTSNPNSATTFNYETLSYFGVPTLGSLVNDGFYIDPSCATKLVAISGSELVSYLSATTNENGRYYITVYLYWYPEGTVAYTINYTNSKNSDLQAPDSTKCSETVKFVIMSDTDWSKQTLPSFTEVNNDKGYEQYFAGWYLNGKLVESISESLFTGSVDNAIELVARWENKYKVTVNIYEDDVQQSLLTATIYVVPERTYSLTSYLSYLSSDDNEFYLNNARLASIDSIIFTSDSTLDIKSYTVYTINISISNTDRMASYHVKVNGVSVTGTQKVRYNATIEASVTAGTYLFGKKYYIATIAITNKNSTETKSSNSSTAATVTYNNVRDYANDSNVIDVKLSASF